MANTRESDLERENRELRAKLAENEARLASLGDVGSEGEEHEETEGSEISYESSPTEEGRNKTGLSSSLADHKNERMKKMMARSPWQFKREELPRSLKSVGSSSYKAPSSGLRAHREAMGRARKLDVKKMISQVHK